MTQKYNTTLNEPILGELCKKGSLYDRLVSLKYFIEDALDDKIPKIRMQIIGFLVDLARCSDHLKKSSINLIVNRFGDLDNKVAAHAQNILHGLMRDKVDDTEIIVGEVCSFITRPNLPFKARYAPR
ncbi:hypothetical protein RF11_07844 [Thelohanellus kitauei]|uniref:Uncharacterized protein n=1 Tax=Thelohanellus kitauei TaxID=669202 RepID=A0A0C2NDJ3_THEKT|nr:hypothetical protein RF11_07844 [Thelohanellus kitauei]